MKLYENILPEQVIGKTLDNYLAKGYYRMVQSVFTTECIHGEHGNMLDCFWLRTLVNEINPINTHKIFIKNKKFSISIGEAKYNDEIDQLYALYLENISFNAPENVQNVLLNSEKKAAFDTQIIEIRDHETLIAVGYFDLGENSIMGILNFYNPHYKKYSLGKLLILLKIDYAQKNKFKYYYTGYIVLGCNNFDYKLFPSIDAIEVFIPEKNYTWERFNNLGKEGLKEFGFSYNILKELNDIPFDDFNLP